MAESTKGPWTCDVGSYTVSGAHRHLTVEDATGHSVVFLEQLAMNPNYEAMDANARLISAAPDLLAACEAALNDRMFKEWPEVATLLKNALAKARGSK